MPEAPPVEHDLDAAPLGILPHGLALVFSRVLLVLRRHPDVLRRADQGAARLLAVMAQAAPFSQLSRPSASGSRPGGCAFATPERCGRAPPFLRATCHQF